VQEDIELAEKLVKSKSLWFGSLESARKWIVPLDHFSPNHLRDTRLQCPACGARIWQIKKAIAVGQGRHWRVWRCDCIFAAASLPLPKDAWITEAKLWGTAHKWIAEHGDPGVPVPVPASPRVPANKEEPA
jgi:hypothetical protein